MARAEFSSVSTNDSADCRTVAADDSIQCWRGIFEGIVAGKSRLPVTDRTDRKAISHSLTNPLKSHSCRARGSMPIGASMLRFRLSFAPLLVLSIACGTDSTALIDDGQLAATAIPYLGLPTHLENVADNWSLAPAFPALTFHDPLCLLPAPQSNRLFVCEQGGRLYSFESDPTVSTKLLALDLSAVTQGGDDAGLLGLAFHPQFGQVDSPNRGYLYLHYAFTPNPIVGRQPSSITPTRSRLSRFTIDLETWAIEPDSEQLLIDVRDRNLWHQGGPMYFHPQDGFLYLAVGDEGGVNCEYDNCQRVDKSLYSGVLRIDVDMQGGDISHPIVRQPAAGVTANYYIPNDNPFVGQPDTLEEFYAIGLRSPHRMTHDAQDDITWIGDVGQDNREELNTLRRGGNYQWNLFEGFLQHRQPPASPLGVWSDPVREFDRPTARTLIGGYVYRGSQHTQLQGKYLFADYFYGRIWSMSYQKQGDIVTTDPPLLLAETEYRDRANGFTSFGIDASGELYLLTLGLESQLLQLVPENTRTNLPQKLSQLEVFENLANVQPVPGLHPYTVQAPLWSDGAVKQRWLALPRDTKIEFSATEPWQFPSGTVLVKNFAMVMDKRQPQRARLLETRLLTAIPNGDFYGITYRWNEAQDDATTVLQRQTEVLPIVQTDGSVEEQVYTYPGPLDCMECHRPEVGFVLGVRTEQINGPAIDSNRDSSSDADENQLERWAPLFDRTLEAPENYRQLVGLGDDSKSLETRLRSYWDSNCSMCHGVRESIRAQWDARASTPLPDQGILNGELVNGSDIPDSRVVVPGQPARSELLRRSASTDPGRRMPLLGSSVPDPQYIELLTQWVQSLEE